MQLLHPSVSMASGGRALRRVDSYPGRPALCRSDSIKKKRSKRARLSAALRELRLAAKARDKDGLLQILVTGHRRRRGSGSGVDGAGAGGSTSPGFSAASTVDADADADQRAAPGRRHGGAGPLLELERPDEGTTGRRRCASSWALAVALVLALACVVALGKAPAICCCTCAAAWWSSGDRAQGQDHASAGSACRRRSGARRGAVTGVAQPQAAASSTNASTVSCRGRQWVIS